MVSIKKREANKKNACLSTGPRTQAGKLRSSANARRHGLATALGDDPVRRQEIERLTQALASADNDPSFAAQARIIVECHLDLKRIRSAQHQACREIQESKIEQLELAVIQTIRFNRYTRRALSRRKTGLKNLVSNDLRTPKLAERSHT